MYSSYKVLEDKEESGFGEEIVLDSVSRSRAWWWSQI
jgi:hypothetical protein